MIDVNQLTKFYGPLRALNAVSFSVAKGEIVGFLGPNGAGKSTTMRILAGFMPADSGSAFIDDYDCFTQSLQVRQRIGYMPESTALYPEMRVDEYLQFRGKLRGLSRKQRNSRLDYVAERCWLQPFIERPIGNLSKGMRQRTALAEALLHDPPVLILDEPTVGLDPRQIRETRSLIRSLGDEHTILLSSHILPEVEATCDRLIVIGGGEVLASGTVDELKATVSRGSAVVVEVAGHADHAKQALAPLSATVEAMQATEDIARLRVIPDGEDDLRLPVSAALSKAGLTVRELRLETASLEEYFVRVVTAGANRAAEAAD